MEVFKMKKIGIHELAKETLVNDINNNIGIFKNRIIPSFVAKDFKDTEYHQAFVVNSDSYGYTFGDDDRPQRLIEAFFSAIALFLAKKKTAKKTQLIIIGIRKGRSTSDSFSLSETAIGKR